MQNSPTKSYWFTSPIFIFHCHLLKDLTTFIARLHATSFPHHFQAWQNLTYDNGIGVQQRQGVDTTLELELIAMGGFWGTCNLLFPPFSGMSKSDLLLQWHQGLLPPFSSLAEYDL
jgi:hypothetical protein